MVNIVTKRVYEPSGKRDGVRILIDRIWPRGISKAKLDVDAWYKDIAPSTELRRWFHHDPDKWQEFRKRYLHELKNNRALAEEILKEKKQGRLTLLYAAKDEEHNHAQVVCEYLNKISTPAERS